MITLAIFAALAAFKAIPSLANPGPLEPSPGSVYNVGSPCLIKWSPDTTNMWKAMNIELKSGSDLEQVDVTFVATVDGTDPTITSYNWTCPEVTLYSAVYFYEFTTAAVATEFWTTRFAIADATGAVTTPPNATQSDGNIPWGIGALADPTQIKYSPTDLSSGGSNSSTATSTTTSPMASNTTLNGTVSSNSSSTSSSGFVTMSSSSAKSTGSSTPSSSSNTNGASRIIFTPALTTLTFVALAFILFF